MRVISNIMLFKTVIVTTKSLLNEEKEKAKRRLNLIVHNVEESTSDDGPTRKQHDIHTVSSQYVSTAI